MATILWLVESFLPQAIVILYPPVIIFWLIIHSNIHHWRKVGRRAYWTASLAWPAISLPLLYFREELFSMRFNVNSWNIAIGSIAILLAMRVGFEAARVIPRRTLVGLAELEPEKNHQPLLKSGIYSQTRNPIYFTHWLLILAAANLSGYVANWTLFGLDAILHPLMIRAEEKELLERYGAEFEAYMREVPRFFPKWPW